MKLLHLYDDLLDLYGDSGNFSAVTRRLAASGLNPQTECKTVGDEIDFTQYAFVYISPGLPANLRVAAADFYGRKDNVEAAAQGGTVFFAVGNAAALFAKSFTFSEGDSVSGISMFDESYTDTGVITIADVVADLRSDACRVCGFVNTTLKIERNHGDCLFDVLSPEGMKTDGAVRGNVVTTQLLGPLLIRNPELLDRVAAMAAGTPLEGDYDDALEREAHRRVMQELTRTL